MSMHNHAEDSQRHDNILTSRFVLVLLGFIAIGGALLFTEHRAHVFGALIWLPLLLCLLMHLDSAGGSSRAAADRITYEGTDRILSTVMVTNFNDWGRRDAADASGAIVDNDRIAYSGAFRDRPSPGITI